MLETPEERKELLRAGFTGREIEKLYIGYNQFKIVDKPILFELVEFDIPDKKEGTQDKVAAESI